MSSPPVDHSYLYKNEVSLSIGDDQLDTIAPTPSPRSFQVDVPIIPEMENASSKKTLPKSPKDSQRTGLDNPGFEPEQLKPRPLSSFGQNGSNEPISSVNGKSSDPKALRPDPVNLEMINLNKPTNGHGNELPVKKDTEVEVGGPYDEYFVPVNEHRKYMRGEKLYVTKDKRIKKNWRKWFCWILCVVIIVAAIVLAILAATGVILSSEPKPIESHQYSDRIKTAGIFGAGLMNENPTEYPVTSPPSESTVPSMLYTTEDALIYVPNALEGQLTLANLEFLEEYENKDSEIYKTLSREVEDEIKQVLKPFSKMDEDIFVKIMDMKKGSVVINYRISWNKTNPAVFIAMNELRERLEKYLTDNHGYLSSYFVPTNTIRVVKIPDKCAMNMIQIDCEMGCEYNEILSDFACICPKNMEVDIKTKQCKDKRVGETYNTYEITRPPKSLDYGNNEPIQNHNYGGHNHNSENDFQLSYDENIYNETTNSQDNNYNHSVDHISDYIIEGNSQNDAKGQTLPPKFELSVEPAAVAEQNSSLGSKLTTETNFLENKKDIAGLSELTLSEVSELTNQVKVKTEVIKKENGTAPVGESRSLQQHPNFDFMPEEDEIFHYDKDERTKYSHESFSNNDRYLTEQNKSKSDSSNSINSNDTRVHTEKQNNTNVNEGSYDYENFEPVTKVYHVISRTTVSPIFFEESTDYPLQVDQSQQHGTDDTGNILDTANNKHNNASHNFKGESDKNNITFTKTYESPSDNYTTEILDTLAYSPDLDESEKREDSLEVPPVNPYENYSSSHEVEKSFPSSQLTATDESKHLKKEDRTMTSENFVQSSVGSFYVTDFLNNTNLSAENHDLENREDHFKDETVPTTIDPMQVKNDAEPTTFKDLYSNINETYLKNSSLYNTTEASPKSSFGLNEQQRNKSEEKENYLIVNDPTLFNDTNISEERDSQRNDTTTTGLISKEVTKNNATSIDEWTTTKSFTNTTLASSQEGWSSTEQFKSVSDDLQGMLYPAPVTEDLSNDTPMPSEIYFKTPRPKKLIENSNINLTDGFVPLVNIVPSVYATTSPIELWSNSSANATNTSTTSPPFYYVTEQSERDATQNQQSFADFSPFLPEQENNATLLNILHRGHDIEIHNDTDENSKKEEGKEENERLENIQISTMSSTDSKNLSSPLEETTIIPLRVIPLSKKQNEVDDGDEFVKRIKNEDKNLVIFGDEFLTDDILSTTYTNGEDETTYSYEDSTNDDATENNESMDIFTRAPDTNFIKDHINSSLSEENTTTQSSDEINVWTSTDSFIDVNRDEIKTKDNITSTKNGLNDELKNQISYGSKILQTFNEDDLQVVPLERSLNNLTIIDRQMENTEKNESQNKVTPVKNITPNYFLDETTFQSIDNKSVETSNNSVTTLSSSNTTTEINQLEDMHEIVEINYVSNRTWAGVEEVNPTTLERTTLNNSNNGSKSIQQSLNKEQDLFTEQLSVSNVPPNTHNNQSQNLTITSSEENAEKITNDLKLLSINPEDYFSKCSAGQFECVNGTSLRDGTFCISQSERCDSIAQCSDGSDEIGCVELGCLGHFQCKNKVCLGRHLVCDGINHCEDGSDEINCNSWQCRFDEISCSPSGTGPCLPSTWKCDGLEQCSNGSDEINCPDNCGNNEFYCSAQRRCIPEIWKCDGEVDCLDEEDERICDCQQGQFKCNVGGCVNESYVCDGISHCPDMSDEFHCIQMGNQSSSESLLQIKLHSNVPRKICADGWTKSLSDQICNNLGYSTVKSYTVIALNESGTTENLLIYKQQGDGGLFNDFTPSSTCRNGVISISCMPYECYSGPVAASTLTFAVNSRYKIKCTAAMIAPKWALASYSCLVKSPDFVPNRSAIVKDWSLQTPLEILSSNKTNTRKIHRMHIFAHTKYNHLMYSNNVVLLELERPITADEVIKPFCLSRVPIENTSLCTVSGWNLDNIENNANLYEKNTTVLTREQCNSRELFSGSLPHGSVCSALEDYHNIGCNTNEGAPLFCKGDNKKWGLQGLLSYHGGCGQRPQSAVYSLLTEDLIRWITNIISHRLSS